MPNVLRFWVLQVSLFPSTSFKNNSVKTTYKQIAQKLSYGLFRTDENMIFYNFDASVFNIQRKWGFFSQIHNAKKPHNSYNSILVHSSSSQGNENQTISWHVVWEIRLFLPDWYQFINLGTCIFCHLIF